MWEIKAGDHSKWTGTFQRKATGLSEYEMRQFFNGLSPKQREERIYETLSRLDPLGEFSKIGVSDTSDLRRPVEMHAEFQTQTPLPSPEFSWLAIFDAPERDRPLLMNDGQQFAIEQTVRMPAGAVSPDQLAAAYDSEVAGEKMIVKWNKVDDKTIETHCADRCQTTDGRGGGLCRTAQGAAGVARGGFTMRSEFENQNLPRRHEGAKEEGAFLSSSRLRVFVLK